LFEPSEVHALLEHSDTNLKAMLLLGLNAALGPHDLALVPIKAIDLDSGWLDYARHKTGIARRIALWPETVQAIREVSARRREPKDKADGGLLFIHARLRASYVHKGRTNRVNDQFRKTAKAAGVVGRSFYDLRRTFQTVGEESGDLVAVQSIMGHVAATNDMSAVYRQRVSDERLRAVTDHVRNWLYGSTTNTME
jgi:integrase